MDGFLIINKPLHYSSMDVIRVVRKFIRQSQAELGRFKIGHAGTLDPLATGVLIVCIGKATKKVSELMDMDKEYITEVDLSAFSNTDDLEGELTSVDITSEPSVENIQECLKRFTGIIDQVPPRYSAIKIGGQPAYKRARRGEEMVIEPKKVAIHDIELVSYVWPILKIKVTCGKGVYIRSLARDIGECLHTGGHVHSLVRSRIGTYSLDKSLALADLQNNPALIVQEMIEI